MLEVSIDTSKPSLTFEHIGLTGLILAPSSQRVRETYYSRYIRETVLV